MSTKKKKERPLNFINGHSLGFILEIGERPGDIKEGSVCGQYLKRYPLTNKGMGDLIIASGAKPIGKSQYMGKPKYIPGTIIPLGDFLLMAFTELNEDGLGVMTYEKYLNCLDELWKQIDKHHGTSDVYLPILGSNIVRFDKELTQQELLDIMISSYRLSSHKLKKSRVLHIVCCERDGFSLNHIFGVD